MNSMHRTLRATYPTIPKVHRKKDDDYDGLFKVYSGSQRMQTAFTYR
jgi:hypothetical protein